MTVGEFIRDTLAGPEQVDAAGLTRDELVMAARAGSKDAALQLLRSHGRQQRYNKFHGKDGKFASGPGGGGGGTMVRGSDQTEWVADNTRDGYVENDLMGTSPLSDPRDVSLMAIGRHQGYDGKPTIGSVDDTVAAGGVEIFRGSAKATNDKMVDGAYEPGTGIYGNGYYFSNKERVADHFAGLLVNGDGGTVVRAALKPGAKVVDYDRLKSDMAAWKAEVAPRTQDLGALYKADFKTPKDMYSPHMVDYVMNDPGRFAAVKGYDAIKVVGHQDGAPVVKGEPTAKNAEGGRFSANDQYIVLNRTALVVEKPKVKSKPAKGKTVKLKDASGKVVSQVDITGMGI